MSTNYVILEQLSAEDNTWNQVTAIVARSARSAIAQAIHNSDGSLDYGTYIAVPARSWRPVTVTLETKTQLKFG